MSSLLLAACLLTAAPLPPPASQDPVSLEDALRTARARRDEVRARLAPEVEALFARLDALPPGVDESDDVVAVATQLAALELEAVVLLVPHLDPTPGVRLDTVAERHARVAREAMAALGPWAAVTELATLARTGSLDGAGAAIELLGIAGTEAAARALRELATTKLAAGRAALRPRVLHVLAAREEPESLALVLDLLAHEERVRVAEALEALAAAARPEGRDAVFALLSDPDRAASLLGPLVAYYRAVPVQFEDDEAEALANAIVDPAAEPDALVEAFDALADLAPAGRAPYLDRLRARRDSLPFDERRACSVALARLGDRDERKRLLGPLDERVDDHDRAPQPRIERAAMYLRLGEWRDAARDLERALDLEPGLSQIKQVRIELARAYVMGGRLQRAADTLEDARLNRLDRELLRAQPDFAPLLADRRHGEVLR